MPELDGPDLVLKMKEEIQKELPPIVALTADVLDVTKQRILEVGMIELIHKPIRKKELTQLLLKYTGTNSRINKS